MTRISDLVFLLGVFVAVLSPAIAGEGCETWTSWEDKTPLSGAPCTGDTAQFWDSPESSGAMIIAPSYEALSQCLKGVGSGQNCFEMGERDIRLVEDEETKALAERLGAHLLTTFVKGADDEVRSLFRGCVRAVERDADGTLWRVKDRLVYATQAETWSDGPSWSEWPGTKGLTSPVAPRKYPVVQHVDGTQFPLGCNWKPVPERSFRKP